MSELFSYTKVAKNALYSEFKFKPYYHVGFHLDALSTYVCHILRTIYDLAATILQLAVMLLSVPNPFAWLGLPLQALELLDDISATLISAFTVAIHPVIVLLRTFSSVFSGYEKNVDDELGAVMEESEIYKEEESDIQLALTIWPSSH